MMESKKFIAPPPFGFIAELAKLCGCCDRTVREALYDNRPGEKSERVRRMYQAIERMS
jgi:hypothetical protein